jgi:gas vesicle protein
MFHSERSFKDFLLGLAVGGSIGAALFNTKNGKKVQKQILTRYHQMSKKAHHYIKDGLEKITLHTGLKSTKRSKATSRKKKRR